MGDWIQVDATRLKTNEDIVLNGVTFHVAVSPFDVPDAVKGHYDKTKNRFLIEFEYIGDESAKDKKQATDQIAFFVGRNSGRLYGIEVDVDAMRVSNIQLRISPKEAVAEALKRLHDEPEFKQRQRNYQMARETIAAHPQIFSELQTV